LFKTTKREKKISRLPINGTCIKSKRKPAISGIKNEDLLKISDFFLAPCTG